jgi:hypothetical protein
MNASVKEKHLEFLMNNTGIFQNYFKEKFPVFYNSNIFLRDLQYSIITFYKSKKIHLGMTESEELALKYAGFLESQQVITKLDHNTWKYNIKN